MTAVNKNGKFGNFVNFPRQFSIFPSHSHGKFPRGKLNFFQLTPLDSQWKFGKCPYSFSWDISQIPRHLGNSQFPWGNFPNFHAEGNFQNFKNISSSDYRLEFGKFPNSFPLLKGIPKFPNIWEVSKFLREISPNSHFEGKFQILYLWISDGLGSSLFPWGNSSNSNVDGNFQSF